MHTTMKCGRCGAPMLGLDPQGGLQDLCPRCVMGFAIEDATQALPPADLPALKPQSTFGPYEILETVGRGGMGVVYRARHTGLDRVVALKMLSPSLAADPEFRARFQREARVLASLSHPNIVTVFDVGTVGDTPYLSMEFIQGVTLRRLLMERRLPPEEALQIVPQLCDALEYAHGAGIVHRDIKPENILIDTAGRVKIADFGLAKLAQGDSPTRAGTLTQTNISMGTPHYMAPEQVENTRTVDHRADIYSLGVVLYEMLTGELPLGRFRPPSRKSPVNSQLDHIVLKALEKEPQDRYQRASHVKADLTRAAVRPQPAPSGRPPLCFPAVAGFVLPLMGLMMLILMTLTGGGVGFGFGCLLSLATIGGGFFLSLFGLIMVLSSRGTRRGTGFAIAGLLVSVGVMGVSPFTAFLLHGSPEPARPSKLDPIAAIPFLSDRQLISSRMDFDGAFDEVWKEALQSEVPGEPAEDYRTPKEARAALAAFGVDDPEDIAPTRLRSAKLRSGRLRVLLVEIGGDSLADGSPFEWNRQPPLMHVFRRSGLELVITASQIQGAQRDFADVVGRIKARLGVAAQRKAAGIQTLQKTSWTKKTGADLDKLWPRDPAMALPPGFEFAFGPVFAEDNATVEGTLIALHAKGGYPAAWTGHVPGPYDSDHVKRLFVGSVDGGDFDVLGFEMMDGAVIIMLRATTPNHVPGRWKALTDWYGERLK